jgi:hypothetical protein
VTGGIPLIHRRRAWLFTVALALALCAMTAAPAGAASPTSTPATRPATGPETPASAPSTAPSSAPAPTPVSEAELKSLVPDHFEVYDRPGDDGSTLLVRWPKASEEPNGAYVYVIEIAKSPAGFDANLYDANVVEPSDENLASANPDSFGSSAENANWYFAAVSPADHYYAKPPKDWLTSKRLDEFAAAGIVSAKTLGRAKAALTASTQPSDANRAAAAKAEQQWFAGLGAYLKKEEDKSQKDRKQKVNAGTYYYRLAVQSGDRKAYVTKDGKPVVLSAQAQPNWFKWNWTNNLLFSLIFCGVVVFFIHAAKRQPNLFIRKIAGLDAVDEAIGRSTEMDRPVFFVHGGASDMSDVATIASVNILARVARRTAEHDSRVRVMNNDPIVTAVSQEVVKQAYTEAGRPDAYNPDDVPLVASDQFSFVAAVSGNMVRERPGAIFLLGSFFAESLLLAETGASTGAIQVAGTDQYTQLPFFITTCDYTLIGEELYAASAYLSREPRLLGSLRGQDVGKLFLMIVLAVCSVVLTLGLWATGNSMGFGWLRHLFKAAGG